MSYFSDIDVADKEQIELQIRLLKEAFALIMAGRATYTCYAITDIVLYCGVETAKWCLKSSIGRMLSPYTCVETWFTSDMAKDKRDDIWKNEGLVRRIRLAWISELIAELQEKLDLEREIDC